MGFVTKLANLYNLQAAVDRIVAGAGESGSRFHLSEQTIKGLHRICMNRLIPDAGAYRQDAVQIRGSKHVCPSHLDVPALMGSMCRYVEENWEARDLIHLSTFVLWRLCWIHPFRNGNGRTARAVSYLVLCARHGELLPAKSSVVSQIQQRKQQFYTELSRADAIYAATQDINATLRSFEAFMTELLKAQLMANFESGE